MEESYACIAKQFEYLTLNELYEILRLRSEIFVVEQQCIYQDIDGVDRDSLHVFLIGWNSKKIAAYLRIFPREGDPFGRQIGRVLSVQRGEGFGKRLMEEALRLLEQDPEVDHVALEAQVQAEAFYLKLGFERVSEPFLEDGIPHVLMVRKLREPKDGLHDNT